MTLQELADMLTNTTSGYEVVVDAPGTSTAGNRPRWTTLDAHLDTVNGRVVLTCDTDLTAEVPGA